MRTTPTNSLHVAYKPVWELEPGFSPEVAHIIARAFKFLDAHPVRVGELALLLSSVSLRMVRGGMSQRQRMQLFYVMSKASWELDECAPTVANAEVAFSLAETLGDWEARAELGYLHGMANSVLFNYAEAADYFDFSLDSLTAFTERDTTNSYKLKLEVEVYAALAMSKFSQTDLVAAAKCAESCLRLAKRLPDQPLLQADAERMAALTYRWRGQPERALESIRRADQLYHAQSVGTSPLMLGRLAIEIADILLDAAAAALARPGGAGQAMHLVAQAALRLRQAKRSADEASDAIGKDLITLTHARYERAAGNTISHVPAIEVVLKGARASDDVSLQAQAHTSLGRELMASGEREAALNCHRDAVALVKNSEISALMKWSRDALIEEFRRQDF